MKAVKNLEAIEKACAKLEKIMNGQNKLQKDGKYVKRAVWSKAKDVYDKISLEHQQILESLWNEGIFI